MPPDLGVSGGRVRSPVGDAPVVPVVLLAVGGYLLWFGVHYFKRDVTWPTDPIKAVLTGKPLPATGVPSTTPHASLTADVQALKPDGGTTAAAAAVAAGGASAEPGILNAYSHAQLVTLWTSQGGNPATANNAACHAIQESSGNPKASSSNPDGGTNYGLWQLDTKGVGAGYPVSQLTDPVKNCQITIMATANGTNWRQWSTPGC